jgi:hypothetical protein
MSKVEKPQAERISECIAILKRITEEVGIRAENPSIRLLKKRMATYWRDGKLQEDKIPLYGYDRIILYRLPRWAHQEVEVTLRVSRVRHQSLPSDLLAELEAQTSSAAQSGPEHPSLQE